MEESFLAVQCVHVSSRERVRSITISSGGGHSCRPSQHFPLYREQSHGAAPRPLTTLALAQHPATLLTAPLNCGYSDFRLERFN